MSKPTVQFLFDFGSPNAYLSHKVLPEIESRASITFEYVPILLGGLFKLANNRSPAESNAAIPLKRAYEHLELKRFVTRHRLVDFRSNPNFPVNTLQIMRGAVAAQGLGCFERYVDVVFASMWEREKKMDDPQVIAAELQEGGLDPHRSGRNALCRLGRVGFGSVERRWPRPNHCADAALTGGARR